MIAKALSLLLSQLNQYIVPISGGDEVVLGNIALAESPDQGAITDKVVLSLVNVEEESTLKNSRAFKKVFDAIEYVEPPVYLNLYLLFSANYPQNYDISLMRLSRVIEFFQSRRHFTIKNARPLPDSLSVDDPQDQSLSLTTELYTMTFEQINHLWGSLGGKQMPFAMYKARLVAIQAGTSQEGSLIEEIENQATPAVNN